MNPELETVPYTPLHKQEDLVLKEVAGVGVLLIVVNMNGDIYTVRETDPQKKGINILTETGKEGEFPADTIRGALIEELGARDLANFQYISRESYLGRYLFPKNGESVHADVVIAVYTGDKSVFQSRNEVVGLGFKPMDELLNNPQNLRKGVLPALQLVNQSNVISQILEMTRGGHGKPIFVNPDKTPEDYFIERQSKPDLLINH